MNFSIKFTQSDKQFSSLSGLKIFADVWNRAGFSGFIHTPKTSRGRKKFEDLALGFAAGAECLDDMQVFSEDSGFQAACSERVYTPKSYGNFLRSFEREDLSQLQDNLAHLGFQLRAKLEKDRKIESMTFDFDSTSNRQYAEKMEGVCYSGEKKYECLTTMYVYDERGIQYHADVRAGNTHTSDKIAKIIHSIVGKIPNEGSYAAEQFHFPWRENPYSKKIRLYARADAGYHNNEFQNACFAKGMGYVVRMRANVLEPRIKQIKNWRSPKGKNNKTCGRSPISFYDGRECEIGSTVYQTSELAGTVRIVCIRAKKQGHLGMGDEDYDTFAWATNIGEHEMSDEKIVYFYRARGHAENFIKEAKNGFDLHHYPCLKLSANKAYALIAAFAYNCMRVLALIDNPKRPHFSKAIRNKLIKLPGQVVRSGREVCIRLSTEIHRRISHWLNQQNIKQFGLTSSLSP